MQEWHGRAECGCAHGVTVCLVGRRSANLLSSFVPIVCMHSQAKCARVPTAVQVLSLATRHLRYVHFETALFWPGLQPSLTAAMALVGSFGAHLLALVLCCPRDAAVFEEAVAAARAAGMALPAEVAVWTPTR